MADVGSTLQVESSGVPLRLVLASASPRRRELLGRLGLDVDVRPAEVDETPSAGEAPGDLVRRLASSKAAAVSAAPDEVVVAADTVVCVDADTLGKPADRSEAAAMLRRLSGRSHRVLTGVAVRAGDATVHAVETTDVAFRELTDAEIEAYVATGEPMDKAGAYAIQGIGGMFVTGIVGSDTNVIGLPLATTVELLNDVGVSLHLS